MLASQFLSSTQLRPVILIAGPNEIVRATCTSRILDEVKSEAVERYDIGLESSRVVDSLRRYDPLSSSRVIILDSFGRADESLRENIYRYSEAPSTDTILICIATSLRDQNGDRWLRSHANVLYIDCGNMTEAGLRHMVSSNLPSNAEIEGVIALADLDVIIEYLELASIFDVMPRSEIHLAVSNSSPFKNYLIHDEVEPRRLYRRMRTRLRQVLSLAGISDMKISIMERSKRAGIEPFVAKALQPMATRSQRDLLLKYLEVSRASRYVDQPGFTAYLGLQACL